MKGEMTESGAKRGKKGGEKRKGAKKKRRAVTSIQFRREQIPGT
jgi:hypothetical protein